MSYKKWDIYIADVAYEDDSSQIKQRPVVIKEDGKAYVIALYTTSQSPKPGYDCYNIRKWKEAGLDRQSNVRLDRIVRLKPEDIHRKIGRLSQDDILQISLMVARLAAKR